MFNDQQGTDGKGGKGKKSKGGAQPPPWLRDRKGGKGPGRGKGRDKGKRKNNDRK